MYVRFFSIVLLHSRQSTKWRSISFLTSFRDYLTVRRRVSTYEGEDEKYKWKWLLHYWCSWRKWKDAYLVCRNTAINLLISAIGKQRWRPWHLSVFTETGCFIKKRKWLKIRFLFQILYAFIFHFFTKASPLLMPPSISRPPTHFLSFPRVDFVSTLCLSQSLKIDDRQAKLRFKAQKTKFPWWRLILYSLTLKTSSLANKMNDVVLSLELKILH